MRATSAGDRIAEIGRRARLRKLGVIMGSSVRLLGAPIVTSEPDAVSIGDRSVLCSDSRRTDVVTKDVAEGAIVAGNPARVVGGTA
jgi:serine acetyltransferase